MFKMNTLIIFAAVISITMARPDVRNALLQHQFTGTQHSTSEQLKQYLPAFEYPLSPAFSTEHSAAAIGTNFGTNLLHTQANFVSNTGLHQKEFSSYKDQPYPEQEPLITKQVYVHSAPEYTEQHKPKHFQLGRPQKNYRVIFVKAPASNGLNSGLSAEHAPSEDKTVIYVLSQKEHEIDTSDIATPAPTLPSKPEVFFIKYKTPEEASHAQQQILAQYDSLGGTSEVSDEGIAPSSSVEGILGGSKTTLTRKEGYLPPSH